MATPRRPDLSGRHLLVMTVAILMMPFAFMLLVAFLAFDVPKTLTAFVAFPMMVVGLTGVVWFFWASIAMNERVREDWVFHDRQAIERWDLPIGVAVIVAVLTITGLVFIASGMTPAVYVPTWVVLVLILILAPAILSRIQNRQERPANSWQRILRIGIDDFQVAASDVLSAEGLESVSKSNFLSLMPYEILIRKDEVTLGKVRRIGRTAVVVEIDDGPESGNLKAIVDRVRVADYMRES